MHAAVPELVQGVISVGAPSPGAGLLEPIATVPPSSSVTSWQTTTQVPARRTKA
ncbi:hypothetical protein FIBSPDRAFT_864470 [Athelia psychrophila]|uniref:Uncharacterized protein n=1 Tax=Athelia psychrophila TaxID=1759441 RepID=A0A166GHK4_9AGAM|nr:hypothetical protein FIBSPDRAFT_864470 [Fibularhizoctonia sp. CBS 109695]